MVGTGNEEASPYAFFSSLLSLSLLPKRSMQRIVLIIMNNVFFSLLLIKFDVIQGFKYGEIDFFLSQTWIITRNLQ